MSSQRFLPVFLAAVALSGCAAPASTPDAAGGPVPGPEIPRLPEAWAYPCPGGGVQVTAEVCVSRVSSPAHGLGEPVVGAHPRDPSFLAVAAMATAAPSPEGAHPVRVLAFVTQDGGASWRTSEIPAPFHPGATTHIDPTLAVDADGVIHYSGLVEALKAAGGHTVFYTASEDGGETWRAPVVLTSGEPDADRNWLTLGERAVYVTWQNNPSPFDSNVAWSRDGGRTWTTLPLDERPRGCTNVAPVVEHGGEPLLACYHGPAIRVFRLDLEAARLELRGEFEAPCYYAFMVEGGGRLVVVCGPLHAVASGDGGRTWGAGVSLAEGAAVEDGWPGFEVTAVSGDAAGGVHLLLAEKRTVTGSNTGLDGLVPRAAIPRIAHLVVDPGSLGILHEVQLTPEGAASPGVDMGPSALKDDFHVLSPHPQGMALAWTRDGGIDVTIAVPSGG